MNIAIDRLAALAHEHRLAIFRHLVTTGPRGDSAGMIGERFSLPPATLSFHLNHMMQAGLLQRRRDGRQVFYSTDIAAMKDLLDFLTENCCAADPACTTTRDGRVDARASAGDQNNEES